MLLSVLTFAQDLQSQLNGSWVRIKNRMLDGSKVLSEPFESAQFFKITFTPNEAEINFSPVLKRNYTKSPFKLEKNIIRFTPDYAYEIQKISTDSLILVQRNGTDTTDDKIQKWTFVKENVLFKTYQQQKSKDSVLIAEPNFTPTLRENFIININKELFKRNLADNFMYVGNLVIDPKKNTIVYEISNPINEKYAKQTEIIKENIASSINQWNLQEFRNFDKIYIPCIIRGQYKSLGEGTTVRGVDNIYFTNNADDFKIAYGLSPDIKRASADNFKKGIQAFEKKQFDKATEYFTKSYDLNNGNVDALYNIAAIYIETKDTKNLCQTLLKLKDLEQTEGKRLFEGYCTK